MEEAELKPPQPVKESFMVKVDSLQDILAGKAKPAPKKKLESITLSWPTEGDLMATMDVEVRMPDDLEAFQLKYMEEKDKAQKVDFSPSGEEILPGKGMDDLYLRRTFIKSPTWLHNEGAYRQFKEVVPDEVHVSLHRKLRLLGGINYDFFLDYGRFLSSGISKGLRAALESGSESSLTKSSDDATEGALSNSPTTTVSVDPKTGENVSSMTLGSSPLIPTTGTPSQVSLPTLSSVTS